MQLYCGFLCPVLSATLLQLSPLRLWHCFCHVHHASLHKTCGVVSQATGSKVERVVITRLENHTYYSRIVLLLPGGIKRSVDSRPSDSLALALQCEAPLFVARQLAR